MVGGQYWVWGRSVLGVGERWWEVSTGCWGGVLSGGRTVLGVREGCRGVGGQYWVLGRGVGG